jgi:hypothetical protein
MTEPFLPLPLFLIVCGPEYDDQAVMYTDFRGETHPCTITTPDGMTPFVAFTKLTRAQAFGNDSGNKGIIVRCGAEKILEFLDGTEFEHACIDPIYGKSFKTLCTVESLISAIKAKIAHEN